VNRSFAGDAYRATPDSSGRRPLAGFAVFTVLLIAVGLYSSWAHAAPVHPFLEANSLDGSTTPGGEFDKACGVAVDDEGDVYVASAGNSAIDVFDPSGAYLTSISGADLCGLAVDSKGNVYAVNTATGNVAVFAPTGGTYPPTAGQTYGAAVTIDSSGDANAVAVNPADDHVFVNQGTRIVEYDTPANGSAVLASAIGEGVLSTGFGVDVYGATGNVYASDESGEVYVFNPAGDEVLSTIDGSESPAGAFGALPKANIAVDQSNGHVLVGDIAGSGAVYEFEASGPYLSAIEHEFQDAVPSDVAVDPSEGPTADRVYVTSGAGPGAQAYAFAPLPVPTHPRLPGLDPNPVETKAKKFQNPCGVVVDKFGNLYVANNGTQAIDIFRPEGKGLKYVTSISDKSACGLAVDSQGNLFVAHPTAIEPANTVTMFKPNAFPFVGVPTYSEPKVIDTGAENSGHGIAVDPANDHLFVAHRNAIFEYDPIDSGSTPLRENVGAGSLTETAGIDVYGKTGYVYAVTGPNVRVIDPVTNKVVVTIDGVNAVSKKPDGGFGGSLGRSQVAVDQADGHVYLSAQEGDVYEFESTGAYVSRFNRVGGAGPFTEIAVDNSGGPNARNVWVASGIGGPASVHAYKGPAQYGSPPEVVATAPSGADGTGATLEGTVDPGGVVLSDCRFEYVDDAAFQATGFATATDALCLPGLEEIGDGDDPVAVHADISGLTPATRYHFRLTAANSFGADSSAVRMFGPPAATTTGPGEVLFKEASLEGDVDPSGLQTTYFFKYGTTEAYGSTTAAFAIDGEAPTPVSADVFDLQPNTTYHFRLVASNSIASVEGSDETFTTLSEVPVPSCPNVAFRTGPSAKLPDCRAYELVSPPDAGGRNLGDLRDGLNMFPAPMSTPDGEGLLLYTEGALPGTNGNGVKDGYEFTRGASGWSGRIIGPDGTQAVSPAAGGITPEHDYGFWTSGSVGGSLEVEGISASYLRLPDGDFELIGLGSSGTDPKALGHWISSGGGHVIFSSTVQLTPDAPPAGTTAVYERSAGGQAQLVSLKPGNVTPGAGEDATYLGASADGSSVAFQIGSVLYLRRGGQTVAVSSANFTFAGLSADGTKLFYVVRPALDPPFFSQPTKVQRGEIFVYDSGAESSAAVGSGGESVVVNVPPDGSHLYFSSRQQLDGGKGTPGEENLYAWDGGTVRFIGTLDSEDIESSGSDQSSQRLGIWVRTIAPPQVAQRLGPAADPSRATPDGSAFVFESFASLTSYDSEGVAQVYRYDTATDALACVSCPFGKAASSAATLQSNFGGNDSNAPVDFRTVIPNIAEDGSAVFFQTAEDLVPQDQNSALDVYEWRAGKVALISPGQGAAPSYLYAISPDGDDVFVATSVTLVPQDLDEGARSIYDARVNGGFAAPPVQLPCQGEECRTGLNAPPALPGPASTGLQDSGNVRPAKPKKCPKGKRAVKRKGKVACVKKSKKQRHAKRQARGGKGGSR
jgi:WD40 repeat protein